MRSRKDSSDVSMVFAMIAIGLGVMGLILPSTTGFLKSNTNNFCYSDSNPNGIHNCVTQYCPTSFSVSTPCISTLCYSEGQRTSTFTTTSTTFVTVLTSTDITCASSAPVYVICNVSFNYKVNSLTGNVQFVIINTNSALQISNIYQVDDSSQAVLSSVMIGSIVGNDLLGGTNTIWSLQTKVSVSTITLTILKADIACIGTNGLAG